MSSPFSLLRQYQRGLLAVFGILIMLVFVLGTAQFDDVVRTWTTSRNKDTMVTWKHGSVSETELQRTMLVHRYTVGFLARVVQETFANKGTPRVVNINQENPGIISARSLQDIFRKKMLAAKAEEMGIVVDDKTVHEFLNKLSDGLLNQDDFARIMRETLGSVRDRRATPEQVFEQLKVELASQNLEMMVTTGLGSPTPSVAWNNFNRLNRRVKVEALPLKVADFKKDVKAEPRESELKDLFEKHKDSFGHPQIATPGFRQWKQIAFQYFKIDYEKFLAEELPKVTEEEIKQEYELGVSRGEYKVQELPPSSDDKKVEEPKSQTEDKKDKSDVKGPAPTDTPKSDAPKTDSPAKDDKPKEEPKQDDGKKPADKPAETPKPEPAKPEPAKPEAPKEEKREPAKSDVKAEDKKPADEKPSEKASDAKPEKKEEKKDSTSQLERGRLDADREFFVNAVDEKPAADAKPEEKKSEAKADEKKAEPKTDKVDAPAADKSKEEKPKEEPAKDEGKKEVPKSDDKAKAEDKAKTEAKPADVKEEKKPEEPKEPKFKPLSEVRDEVARRVAKPRAQEAKKKVIAEVKKLVEAYGRERRVWEKFKDTDEPKLDFEALAAKFHIDFGKTDYLTAVTAQEHELGKNDSLFTQKAFFSQAQPYKPQAPEFDNDLTYIWWKTAEIPEKVLDFKEAREQVLDAWKKKEALVLAKKAAEEKVKSLKDKETLAAAFGKDVIETNPFTWMTAGNVPWSSGMPMMSSVEGIEFAGREFMEKVFSLKEGEAGVAVNEPESVVYVVRVAQDLVKESLRRELFLESGNNMMTRVLWFGERRALRDQWHADLEKEMHVVWREQPRTQESEE